MHSRLAHISRNARILIATSIAYVILLCLLATVLADSDFKTIFSETGFFEQSSIIAWVTAAIVLVFRARQQRSIDKGSYLAHAMLFLLCAMREADWHKKFTADGILKIKYYTKSTAAFAEKIPAGLVALLFIVLMLHALVRSYRHVRIKTHLMGESTWIMIAGIALFFAGKILDRSISVLTESFGLSFSPLVKKIIAAQEEGLEMLTPVLIALAFLWPSNQALVNDKKS
jgi:hypothetical protein